MPKKEPSPKCTAWFPPNEDCPDSWTKCYEDALDDCVLEIVQNQVASGIERARGLQNLQWDLIISPVVLEIITPHNEYRYEWKYTDWKCLSDYIEHVRHRLDELFDNLSLKSVEQFQEWIDMESIGKQAWNSFILPKLKDIRETERLAGFETAKEEGLSGILGLERGTRARKQMEKLAGIRLNRWDTDYFKSTVREARRWLKG